MIRVLDKHKCCGCTACQSACPKQCISMKVDSEGFLYPSVDLSACVDCHLCERVCPVIIQSDTTKPLRTLAAVNSDETVRLSSSSGGIFSALAEKIISEGGKVYGARFNKDLGVEHCGAESLEGIADFRGSKYLQSTMGDTYKDVRSELDRGTKVLFSGTPCQVAGLRRFLRKDYDNLIAVDFVCHGVPSPAIWQGYLRTFSDASIDYAAFRDKQQGWHRYGVRLKGALRSDAREWHRFGIFSDNRFMQVFLANLSLRPSCYDCPAKSGSSGSDITLGDFWGIEHIDSTMDDDRGTSLVLVNSPKGQSIIDDLNIKTKEEPYDQAVQHNPSIAVSVEEPVARTKFFSVFNRFGFDAAYKATMVPSLSRRVLSRVKGLVGKVLGEKGRKIAKIIVGR